MEGCRQLIVTLYKNTQTEGEKKSDIYSGLWQFSPYEPISLFASGFTSEKGEFVIPDGFTITKYEGKDALQRGNYLYEIFTNPSGRPGLRNMFGGAIFYDELLKPGEEPPKPEKPKSNAWVPGYDKNGELEIF